MLIRQFTQLNTLVDLKQKQNNMIDTRTARLQAEQSHTMAMEAERQGRTLMVFTIVTIIFVGLMKHYS
jgi:plasmid rolling circle replication initiator protein Rep